MSGYAFSDIGASDSLDSEPLQTDQDQLSYNFAAFRHPEHASLIQRVLAIPPKRFERALVTFLTASEIDALLASPDRSTWIGRRDHALLVVALQTGLRVSELIGLTCGDVDLRAGAHLGCRGKGRKEPDHPARQSGDTDPPTHYSPSSKACDYAASLSDLHPG